MKVTIQVQGSADALTLDQKAAIEKIIKHPIMVAYQLEVEDFDPDKQLALPIEEEAIGWTE